MTLVLMGVVSALYTRFQLVDQYNVSTFVWYKKQNEEE